MSVPVEIKPDKDRTFIEVYDNVLSSEYCAELIQRIDKDPRLKGVTDNKTYDLQQLILWQLHDWDETNQFLSRKFAELSQMYYDKYMPLWPGDFQYESIKFKKYDHTKDEHFKEHVDVDDVRSCVRFLTSLWFLNDIEYGGETVFTEQGLQVQPRAGRVILFPPLWTHPHYSNKAPKEDKFIFTQYLHYSIQSMDPLV